MNYNATFAVPRGRSSNRSGGSFDSAVLEAVWRKGQVVHPVARTPTRIGKTHVAPG